MAFTYTGDPASSSKDLVRFLIGDTVSTAPLLQDAEINYLVSKYVVPERAAYMACLSVAATFSRKCDGKVGDVARSLSQKSKQYIDLAKELAAKANLNAISGTGGYAGGISVTDKDSNRLDTDRVQPGFTRNSDDFPSTAVDPSREGG